MKQFGVILMLIMYGFLTEADTTLVLGFDTTDDGTDINGIVYESSKQSMAFSGGVSASGQTTFNLLDDVDSTVGFSIGAVGDLLSFNGTITPFGGAFNIGGNGSGIVGGARDTYIDPGESWSFTFSEDVILTAVRYYGEDIGGQSILTNGVAVTGSPFDDDFSGESIFVTAGSSLVFGEAGSGNYGLQDFTITVVPEPVAMSLIGAGGLILVIVRRMTRS